MYEDNYEMMFQEGIMLYDDVQMLVPLDEACEMHRVIVNIHIICNVDCRNSV